MHTLLDFSLATAWLQEWYLSEQYLRLVPGSLINSITNLRDDTPPLIKKLF